eukprot:TRINITY_DN9281_c0_g1_i1.p1 TRINITY_DN9281_c0_g1~~TRINITY_DN9281_c0_g1_i1.p1  ORF type:complete len:151 (-),score=33.58 TRINITY_DN9281_c0_g1_i1:4-396(-)
MPGGKTQRRRRNAKKQGGPIWKTYTYKVLKQVHPDTGMMQSATCIMNSFVNHMFSRIMAEALNVTEMMSKRVVTPREIQTATRLVLQGELAKHGVSEATKSLTKYTQSAGPNSAGPVSYTHLTLPTICSV